MDGDRVTAGLAVQGLHKLYRGTDGPAGGLHEASFQLEPGTFFTLLGPSGCGKTTTLRSIAGLETPDRGSIRLGDQVFFDAARCVDVPLNRRGIGMVFQSYAIWPHMTVFENVAFPLRVTRTERFDRDAIRRMVGTALDTVGLGSFGDRPATRLSGGQQQRVALARAIVRRPKLLLLDEPLSNLDATLREEMRTELKRLQAQIGVTTIYVTHDQSEALDMSDRIAVMKAGRIVQIGPPQDIYFRPCDSFVAGFVGATNLLPGVAQGAVAAGGTGGVALPDSRVLQCLFPQAAARGARIMVSVWPESLRLVPGPEAAPGGCNRLDGTVARVNFQGSTTRYGVRVGDAVLQVSAGPEMPVPVGTEVGLAFQAAQAIALPDEG